MADHKQFQLMKENKSELLQEMIDSFSEVDMEKDHLLFQLLLQIINSCNANILNFLMFIVVMSKYLIAGFYLLHFMMNNDFPPGAQ